MYCTAFGIFWIRTVSMFGKEGKKNSWKTLGFYPCHHCCYFSCKFIKINEMVERSFNSIFFFSKLHNIKEIKSWVFPQEKENVEK